MNNFYWIQHCDLTYVNCTLYFVIAVTIGYHTSSLHVGGLYLMRIALWFIYFYIFMVHICAIFNIQYAEGIYIY